jgi:hypothetical protein
MNDSISKAGRAYRLPIISHIVGLYYNDLVVKHNQPIKEFTQTMIQYTTILNNFRNNVDYTLIQHFIKECVSLHESAQRCSIK